MKQSLASARPRAGLIVVLGALGVGSYAFGYRRGTDQAKTILNQSYFSPFRLQSREKVSSTSSIFTLTQDAKGYPRNLEEFWSKYVWSVELKQPQLQIARSYTPLPPLSTETEQKRDENSNELRLLIRKEQGGEVSNYLHRVSEDSSIEVRGPHVELEIPEHTNEVIFLAGGTGIAPALQVAHLLNKRPQSRMTVLWANRSIEDCEGAAIEPGSILKKDWRSLWTRPVETEKSARTTSDEHSDKKGAVVRHLETIRSQSPSSTAFDVKYFVDEQQSYITPETVQHAVQQSPGSEAPRGAKLILVSGPDGFLDHWAGKKVWTDGHESQGPLRGKLSQMHLRGWTVWKL